MHTLQMKLLLNQRWSGFSYMKRLLKNYTASQMFANSFSNEIVAHMFSTWNYLSKRQPGISMGSTLQLWSKGFWGWCQATLAKTPAWAKIKGKCDGQPWEKRVLFEILDRGTHEQHQIGIAYNWIYLTGWDTTSLKITSHFKTWWRYKDYNNISWKPFVSDTSMRNVFRWAAFLPKLVYRYWFMSGFSFMYTHWTARQ